MNNNSVVNVDLRKYALVENKEWVEIDVNGETVQIPMHWSTGPLTDLILLKNGSAFKPEDWARTGRPIIRIQNLTNPSADVNRFNGDKPGLVSITKDDYLFAWSGTIDVFKYKGEPAYLNQHIFKVTAKTEHNLDYSIFCLRYHLPKIPTNGLGMAHITTAELNRFTSIYTPNPSEQTAIASVLSTQESIISDISLLISKHEQRLAWLSDQLLSGKLRVRINGASTGEVLDIGDTVTLEGLSFYQNPDDNWKEVDVNGETVQIPMDWDVKSFEDLAQVIAGQSPEGHLVSDIQDNGKIPFHQGNSNFNGGVIKTHNRFIDRSSAPKKAMRGDILLSVRAPVGDLARADCELCIGRGLAAVRTKANYSPDFVKFLLLDSVQHLKAVSAGAIFEAIRINDLTKMHVKIPAEAVQHWVGVVLSAQEALISDYKKLLEKEKQRMEWLSDALLSGKYRLQAIES